MRRMICYVRSEESRPKSHNRRLSIGYQRYQCLKSRFRPTSYRQRKQGKYWGAQLHRWQGILWEQDPSEFYRSPRRQHPAAVQLFYKGREQKTL